MSLRRLIIAAAMLASAGVVLLAVSPSPSAAWAALASPQHVVDTAGPDGVLLPLTAVLAWLAWGWATLGLAATAAAALPGAAGRIGQAIQGVVLPAAGRRGAALLIGVSVGLSGPVGTGSAAAADAATAGDAPAALDWPGADVPDWPAAAPAADSAADEVVAPGDCLWTIAAGRLTRAGAPRPADEQIAATVRAWWTRNAEVIGPDPDLLLPGQRLRPPEPP